MPNLQDDRARDGDATLPPGETSPRVISVESIFGPMFVFEGDHAARQILEFGAHTRNELALLKSFVNEGDLVYNVGAHVGTFAIPLAHAVGESGRVIAIEADRVTFPLLCRNIERQGLSGRMHAIEAVAGGETAAYSAVRIPLHTSATHFVPDAQGEALGGCKLDDAHARLADGRIAAVIKIDVEGMELAVLKSAEAMIARDRPILYVEMVAEQMARYGVTFADMEAFLRRYSYRFFRNTGPRNSTNDNYELVELAGLAEGGQFYDLLAVPEGHPKLGRARNGSWSV